MKVNQDNLDIIYSFLENNIAKYILNANPYFEDDDEQQEGLYRLKNLENNFNKIKEYILSFCERQNLIPNLLSYNPKYSTLNYLSYKFLKGYIKKEVEKENKILKDFFLENDLKIKVIEF